MNNKILPPAASTLTATRLAVLPLAAAIVLAACTPATSAEPQHACDYSAPDRIAKHFNVSAESVSEKVYYESRDKTSTTECQWQFINSTGNTVDINFRKKNRTEKITNPNYFANNLQRLQANGRTVGSKTVNFQAKELAGIKSGIISALAGNRFTKTLDYLWHEDEQRLLRVSLNHSINDSGELSAPTEAELAALIKLFKTQ